MHPRLHRHGATAAGTQDRAPAAQEAREHPPVTDEPHIQVLKGNPTDEELAALITVLGSAGRAPEPAQPEQTRWGLPVDRLRYAISNYQRITLQERMHMRR
ncbi:hypothetical protein BMG05_24670 [Mycobacterium malmoense]|nr:hypothetical protein BMG05_24670 [Mycobacterium malmoense]